MEVRDDHQPYDEINITPMLDLAYVLLVTFIIMTTAAVQGIRVELPRTLINANLSKPATKAITVTGNGDIYLDAYPVTVEQLEQRLNEHKAINPALPVVLKGDAQTQYGPVMEVLELLKKLDITEVGLVTKRRLD